MYRRWVETYTTHQDYIIAMFLTEGLCEEAANCIYTLKKLNLHHKLIVTCLDKEAEACIKALGVKTRYKDIKLANEASFGTKDFYNIMYEKLVMIQEVLEQTNKVVLYTDTDIVFLKDPSKDITNFINSSDDVMFQDEGRNFDGNKDYGCAGFMVFKPNVKSIDLLLHSQKLMKDNWDNRKWDNGGGADQKAINIAKKDVKGIKYSYFDAKDYPNGARYFGNIDTVYKDFTPVMVHNNFITGLDKKIQRFKKHGLWFIKENFVSNSKYF